MSLPASLIAAAGQLSVGDAAANSGPALSSGPSPLIDPNPATVLPSGTHTNGTAVPTPTIGPNNGAIPTRKTDPTFEAHCKLLGLEADADTDADADDRHQILTAPLFTAQVRDYAASSGSANFTQFGLLAGVVEDTVANGAPAKDPRLFYNVAAPSSIFICGRHGSGKSHTLSVLLENSLAPSDASTLPRPLTGIVFHYDRFVSDDSGAPCEAAYLSSNPSVKVRVLCAPTNVRYIRVGPPHHAEPRGLTRLFRALANAPRGHRTSTRPRGSTLVWTSCALTKRT